MEISRSQSREDTGRLKEERTINRYSLSEGGLENMGPSSRTESPGNVKKTPEHGDDTQEQERHGKKRVKNNTHTHTHKKCPRCGHEKTTPSQPHFIYFIFKILPGTFFPHHHHSLPKPPPRPPLHIHAP